MKPEDKDSKLTISKVTALKYLQFDVSVCEVFVISIGRLPLCSNAPGKKKSHPVRSGVRGGRSLLLHAQSTDEGNSCQATHEQEAQNVMVLHVA